MSFIELDLNDRDQLAFMNVEWFTAKCPESLQNLTQCFVGSPVGFVASALWKTCGQAYSDRRQNSPYFSLEC